MSTSFPHGFHGFQGLVPTNATTNTNTNSSLPITNRTVVENNSTTYRPGGQSSNRDNDIECRDEQPLTCAVAMPAGSDCDNDCVDVPVSIAVPIYGNGQLSGM